MIGKEGSCSKSLPFYTENANFYKVKLVHQYVESAAADAKLIMVSITSG